MYIFEKIKDKIILMYRLIHMEKIGILAYGSLIDDPGIELEPLIKQRIRNVLTPFKVEFARKSKKRGYGPTLIPVEDGGTYINAEILILKKEVTEIEVKNLIWRRETNNINSGKQYNPPKNQTINTVLVKKIDNFKGIKAVFYTHIDSNIEDLNPSELARLAIESVKKSKVDMDGIAYLINIKKYGIKTPLMKQYESEIHKLTETESLNFALKKLRNSHGNQ